MHDSVPSAAVSDFEPQGPGIWGPPLGSLGQAKTLEASRVTVAAAVILQCRNLAIGVALEDAPLTGAQVLIYPACRSISDRDSAR